MTWKVEQGDAEHLPLADDSVDLVFGSPPYCSQRLYLENGHPCGAARSPQDWIEWMLRVTTEACRVSRGLVLWVCASPTKDWCYQPACEGLLYEWWKRGGQCWRPCYWHRVGIPGSGGKQWYRADVEYVLAFKREQGKVPWAEPTANGHPPKWGPGGEMSNRTAAGARVNQWGNVSDTSCGRNADGTLKRGGDRPSHKFLPRPFFSMTARGANGERKLLGGRAPLGTGEDLKGDLRGALPAIANPGVLVPGMEPWEEGPGIVHTNVGGGALGHPLAHENEAPFPVDLAAWFIRSHCPPGGTVLDVFCGSGSSIQAAVEEGRNGIGFDLRASQVELARLRLANPRAKAAKRGAVKEPSLFGVAP